MVRNSAFRSPRGKFSIGSKGRSTLRASCRWRPPYPLQVDTSLNTVNAGVYNVVISSARLSANAVNYVLQDVQGSTRAVMSGASVIARHDFYPFGEEIGAGVGMRTNGQGYGITDKIRQRYAMTERDDSTGLDHTWWRKYENTSGRWTSPDPYRGSQSIANPQSFNRYAYVQNDPMNFVDPSGLLPMLVCYWGPSRTSETGSQWTCAVLNVPEPRDPGEPNPRGGRGPRSPTQQQKQPCSEQDFSFTDGPGNFTTGELSELAQTAVGEGGQVISIKMRWRQQLLRQ